MAKKGLIFETLNDVKTMSVHKSDDGLMRLSGVFGVCGVKNNNHRVYEHKNYKKMVEALQSRIQRSPIPGELEHPQTMNINLENISHRIDSIQIDENGVVSGEISLLNTPKGLLAQAIVEGGLPLFISSRAQGQVDRNGNVTLENLVTYDLVGSPGFSQAELHLNENQCFESINESICFIGEEENEENEVVESKTKSENEIKENNDEMDNEKLNEILEQLDDLKSQVEYLTEQNNLLQEQLDEKQDIDIKQLAEGIQSWVINEYSPAVQGWIVEEYSQKVQDWVVENYSEQVQNWVVEQFAPEVQKWVVEHYSPEVQNWVVEQFAPEIQNWICEEYSSNLQKWMETEYSASITESLKKEMEGVIAESKKNKLEIVDSLLEMLDNTNIQKPAYGRKTTMVQESNAPKYIAEMPADIRVKYDLASQDVKESIQRRAKIYDWSKDNAIENFWESVDFDKAPVKTLNENLTNIVDDRERALRMSIRQWRNR